MPAVNSGVTTWLQNLSDGNSANGDPVLLEIQDYHQLVLILIPTTLLCQPKLLFMVQQVNGKKVKTEDHGMGWQVNVAKLVFGQTMHMLVVMVVLR